LAVAASLVFTLVDGPLLHRLDLPVLESWGILALQLLAVASFTSLMAVLIGRWAILPTFLFFVVLGNSASGGAVAPPLLPPPFAFVSKWLPLRRHGDGASRRGLLPGLSARPPDRGPRDLGNGAARGDAGGLPPARQEPGNSLNRRRTMSAQQPSRQRMAILGHSEVRPSALAWCMPSATVRNWP